MICLRLYSSKYKTAFPRRETVTIETVIPRRFLPRDLLFWKIATNNRSLHSA